MDAAPGNFHGGGILFGTPLCALAGIERGAVFLDFCETSPTGTHRNHAFLQFNRISPHDLRFRRWHFIALAFQIVMFILFTWLATLMPDGDLKILTECAMLCFICPHGSSCGSDYRETWRTPVGHRVIRRAHQHCGSGRNSFGHTYIQY